MSINEDAPIKPIIVMEDPSEEVAQWAKENINEDPDKKDQIISDFRDLIFARGECTPHRTDDAFLLRFLRARYFIIKKAHRLIVNYYDFKEANPQYYNIKLERIRELARDNIISVPPYKDQLGRRIMIQRLGTWNPSQYTIDELFQLSIGILETAILDQSFQIQGAIAIFDLSELSFTHVWKMNSTIANHLVSIAMSSFPFRLEAIHVLHQSWIFEIAFNFIKPLLREGVKDRIYFHGDDMESFHNHVDPKHLPKIYGGIHMDYPVDIWFEECVKYDDRIIEDLVALGYTEIGQLKEEREYIKKQ